jgi:hypothetical protein
VSKACKAYRGGKKYMQGFVGCPELKAILQIVGVDGKISKLILSRMGGRGLE